MSALPSITVVIPARNAEATLAGTLESIRAQTHESWEVVLVDDGSTDRTAEIGGRFAAEDGRFRVLSRDPAGVSAARNAGLEAASHPWVLFLDADDLIRPGMLARVARRLAGDPDLDLVQVGWGTKFPDGSFQVQDPPAPGEDLFTRATAACPFPIHTAVVRKTLIERLGGFDPSLATSEDWDMWMRCGRAGARTAFVDEVLAVYCMRGGSASTRARRVLQDGLRVTRRAFSSDERVPDPVPEYARGLPDSERPVGEYRYLGWAAGLAVSGGQDPAGWIEDLTDPRCPTLQPADVAIPLFISTLLGRTARPGDWGRLWPELEGGVVAFFEAVERASGAPDLAARARRTLVNLVIAWSDSPVVEGLEGIHDVEVELTEPLDIDPPADATRIHARIRYGGWSVGRVALPALAGEEPTRLVETEAARRLGWALLGVLDGRRTGSPSPVLAAFESALPRAAAERAALAFHGAHKKGFEWLERALVRRRFFADVLRSGGDGGFDADGDALVVDVSEGLPRTPLPADREVEVRFGRIPVGRIRAPAGVHPGPRRLRRTIRRELADELAAAVVRLALFGRPAEGPDSLLERARERLREEEGNAEVSAAATLPTVPLRDSRRPSAAALQRIAQRVTPAARRALGARAIAERLPILAYHRVDQGARGRAARFQVDPHTFESHLAFLRERGFYSVTIEEWEDAVRGRAVLRGKPILITFDDGYADVFETAAPLLARYGFSAAVFLVTDLVGGTSRWDRHLGSEVPLLDWDQIRELERRGVRFGSHTARHVPLGALAAEEVAREVSDSAAALAARLDGRPAGFAYPYGDADDVVRFLVGRGGFRFGFTTRSEPATGYHHRLDLPRIEVLGWDGAGDLARKMWLDPEDRP